MLTTYRKYLINKPKKLLFTDGIGAFYTATMLLIIKNLFISYIGLPTFILEYLAVMACSMGLFSISAAIFVKKDYGKYLRVIAIINLIYCTITIAILVLNRNQVLLWGVAYFVIEILVIFSLSLLEIKVSKILSSGKSDNKEI